MANQAGSYPKRQRREYQAAIEQGWRVVHKPGGHWTWYPPDGGTPIWSSGSYCRGRGDANHRARLKRAGLVLP